MHCEVQIEMNMHLNINLLNKFKQPYTKQLSLLQVVAIHIELCKPTCSDSVERTILCIFLFYNASSGLQKAKI